MDNRSVPPITIPASDTKLGPAELEAVARVMASGMLAGSVPGVRPKEVGALEQDYAAHLGVREAVAVANGTAALHLCLHAAGVGPGDRVVVPPLSFFATVEAVLHCGGVPVFCDVTERGLMDPEQARRIARNEHAKAVVPVHMFGDWVDMPALLAALTGDAAATVIEDAAQAHGTTRAGRFAGTWGRAGCFSLYATKHVTALGEGGVIATDDVGLAGALRMMRNHGMSDPATHQILGWNYRLSEAAAAVARVRLRAFMDTEQQKRVEACHYMLRALDGHGTWKVPWPPPEVQHGYFLCTLQFETRAVAREFVEHMRRWGVECRCRERGPLYDQPVLIDRYGLGWMEAQKARCPRGHLIAGTFVGLPSRHDLTREQLDYIIGAAMDWRP